MRVRVSFCTRVSPAKTDEPIEMHLGDRFVEAQAKMSQIGSDAFTGKAVLRGKEGRSVVNCRVSFLYSNMQRIRNHSMVDNVLTACCFRQSYSTAVLHDTAHGGDATSRQITVAAYFLSYCMNVCDQRGEGVG